MLGIELTAGDYLARSIAEIQKLDAPAMQRLAAELYRAWQERRTVFICGNGGSGSNASHFCEDLGKSSLDRKDFENDDMKRLRVLSLTDNTPYILAWANDEGFDRVFVEQLKNLADPGDILIAISGSGNSPNVLKAVEWAQRHGISTWGMTGYTGGKLRTLAGDSIHVPLDDMGLVESFHLLMFHWILNDLHARINQIGRYSSAAPEAEQRDPNILNLRRRAA